MRVKNDHPNTEERPQQVQQRPVTNVSAELESCFHNALKSIQTENEHELESSYCNANPVKSPFLVEQAVVSKETDKSQPDKGSNDKQANTVIPTPSVDGLLRTSKALITSLPHALKDKVPPIQLDQNKASTVLNVEYIELCQTSSESDAKLHPTTNLSQSIAQGDIILRNVETQAPQSTVRDMNELINKLVDKIYVYLPSADKKEVHLLLNEGQLKGGEISIKQDSSGYSIMIKQEHALSLISQTAKQELIERLLSLGITQPIQISVSEQMNQPKDQQHSRQQRSIYDEWKPEDEQ